MTGTQRWQRHEDKRAHEEKVGRYDERVAALAEQDDADIQAVMATLPTLLAIPMLFAIILCDCPWRFIVRSPKGDNRRVPYRSLPTDLICRFLPPAHRNALLCFWALPHMSRDAHRVIEVMGFGANPKSKLYWFKKAAAEGPPVLGKGYWTREDQAEEMWLCTRGSFVCPMPGTQFKQGWYLDEPTDNSRKPLFMHEELERLYPNPAKLEMFARPPFRRGWHVFGDEVPGFYMTPEQAEAAGLVA